MLSYVIMALAVLVGFLIGRYEGRALLKASRAIRERTQAIQKEARAAVEEAKAAQADQIVRRNEALRFMLRAEAVVPPYTSFPHGVAFGFAAQRHLSGVYRGWVDRDVFESLAGKQASDDLWQRVTEAARRLDGDTLEWNELIEGFRLSERVVNLD